MKKNKTKTRIFKPSFYVRKTPGKMHKLGYSFDVVARRKENGKQMRVVVKRFICGDKNAPRKSAERHAIELNKTNEFDYIK